MIEPPENAGVFETVQSPRSKVQSISTFVPVLGLLLFLGALFWAKSQDPFSRRWFTLQTADHSSFDCVAVLPKPVRRYPVVIYAHGSDGTLMNDGDALRQMAELGLAAVSLDYNQTNETVFAAQWTALHQYLVGQKWADTNAIAWVGASLGANWIFDFARHETDAAISNPSNSRGDEAPFKTNSELPYVVSNANKSGPALPRLLVLISESGLLPDPRPQNPDPKIRCPVLLIHGDQDEVFPVADTVRFAGLLQTNGVSVSLKILPGLSHGLDPENGVVFRSVGEYCLAHLAGPDAWGQYHSVMQWQAETPSLWPFFLPALAALVWMAWQRRKASPRAGQSGGTLPIFPSASEAMPAGTEAKTSRGSFWRIWGRRGRAALPWNEVILRWLAGLLAAWALTETGLHLVPPHLPVSPATLSLARRILVQPKERPDFEYLAAQPIWSDAKLRTLLDHVQLAGYNRQLVNWQVDDTLYREEILSPVITGRTGEKRDWRRPLWEEFYPRIRHETMPGDAARIVVRHLRERVTIASLPGLPHEVPDIWRRQITDPTGFAIIYVAALRSVGVPARLDSQARSEFWDGNHWQIAPPPVMVGW